MHLGLLKILTGRAWYHATLYLTADSTRIVSPWILLYCKRIRVYELNNKYQANCPLAFDEGSREANTIRDGQ